MVGRWGSSPGMLLRATLVFYGGLISVLIGVLIGVWALQYVAERTYFRHNQSSTHQPRETIVHTFKASNHSTGTWRNDMDEYGILKEGVNWGDELATDRFRRVAVKRAEDKRLRALLVKQFRPRISESLGRNREVAIEVL